VGDGKKVILGKDLFIGGKKVYKFSAYLKLTLASKGIIFK